MLDTIGALIIGGALLVAMWTAYTNYTAMHQNANMQMNLTTLSEEVSLMLGSFYLPKVGSGVPTGTAAIQIANSTGFQFLGRESYSTSVDTFYVFQDTVSTQKVVKVSRNGVEIAGPFFMNSDMNITYYNQADAVTATISDIRSVKVEIELVYEGWSTNANTLNLVNKIVFWTYFKNLYI